MKFLVDECLSPKLALLARERGHPESSHVVWEGQGGIQDWNLMAFVLAGDWTLVTKNSIDFRGPAEAPGAGGQYRHVALHAGLVCLNAEDMDRSLQLAMFEAVLDSLAEQGDLINQGIDANVSEIGSEEIEIVRYTLPVDAPL
jgi:predicted nuclease of predicted toxin-antitoxin system